MADDERPGRCWYCGRASLRKDDPPEHIIPDSMGGRLTTDRICRACNQRAGSEIDRPFMEDWLIAMERALHSPRGDRMQPRVEAALDDGTKVDLETRRGPWRARIRASIEWEGDQVRIRASNMEEYEKLLARVRRDAEQAGRRFTEPGVPYEFSSDGPVAITSVLDGVVWLRMAAKVTLGCVSKVLDESWLDTDDAEKYRGWLWDGEPVNPDGSPAGAFPVPESELDRQVLRPPEHLIYFAPVSPGRVILSVAYFGSMLVRAPVETGDQPIPRTAWRTGVGHEVVETSFDALLLEAAVAFVKEHEEEDATPE